MLLDFKFHEFDGDAISRMANGFYVLHSRDPHLAAIGFVWNPLSSLVTLPLLLFNSWWSDLASHNVAGTTMSALAMAGAVYQLNSLLREWRVHVAPRLVLTLLFACAPMIMLYAGNGMSEALYTFLMLGATRYLMRWLRDDDLASLVYAASMLGLAYMERSEPVASAVLAAPFVCWVTFTRTAGDRRSRIWAGLSDATILVMPIVTCFIGWAVVSWVIVGQPFEQFTSKYGNSALIAAAHIQKGHLGTKVLHEVHAIGYLAPALPVILVAALVSAAWRRNAQIWVLATVLGGGLAFTLVSYLDDAIFPWIRYYVLVTPIAVLLVGSLFSVPTRIVRAGPVPEKPVSAAPAPEQKTLPGGGRKPSGKTLAGALLAVVVSIALLAPSIPFSIRGMNNPVLAPDVYSYYGFIFHKHLTAEDQAAKGAYSAVQGISGWLDAQHYPNGDVVVDTGDNCIPNVVTNVDNPRLFVITNDRDFQKVLADPLTFHAHYLMIEGNGTAQADGVAQLYPHIATANWAHLVHTFPPRGFCVQFKLYQVTGHPQGTF
jgi:hypothetical protein